MLGPTSLYSFLTDACNVRSCVDLDTCRTRCPLALPARPSRLAGTQTAVLQAALHGGMGYKGTI